MASVVPDELEKATGIKPYCGCVYEKKLQDDPEIETSIDDLSLDYSILDEIDYEYPESGSFYGYTTRGCKNRCKFCAVPIIEPKFKDYIPLKNKIEETRKMFGDQHNLLLLDNNIFASKHYDKIIDEIKSCGYHKGAIYIPENQLEVSVRQLKKGWNDRAYVRKTVKILLTFLEKLKDEEYNWFYSILFENGLLNHYTADKKSILTVHKQIKEIYEKKRNKTPRQRYIDFNQGVDARRATETKIKKLSDIAICPLRIAFDSWNLENTYKKAVYYAVNHGINKLSNYVLYNFNDRPVELYKRLKLNVELCEKLQANIYSFPMKYHPIMDKEYFKNREYLGVKGGWNRKYIRAIQAILNATKGKVGKGKDFFEKAFGKNEKEFKELLIMPEAFIIYRFHFEKKGLTEKWRNAYNELSISEKRIANKVILSNKFSEIQDYKKQKKIYHVLSFYRITRDSVKNNILLQTKLPKNLLNKSAG